MKNEMKCNELFYQIYAKMTTLSFGNKTKKIDQFRDKYLAYNEKQQTNKRTAWEYLHHCDKIFKSRIDFIHIFKEHIINPKDKWVKDIENRANKNTEPRSVLSVVQRCAILQLLTWQVRQTSSQSWKCWGHAGKPLHGDSTLHCYKLFVKQHKGVTTQSSKSQEIFLQKLSAQISQQHYQRW